MRRMAILSALAGAALVMPLGGVAVAGGGCHTGATQAAATGQRQVTVALVDACFTPSTLFVDPGTSVTFVSHDPFEHNVGGNLWGHFDPLHEGDRFTATFSEEGIYPFACSYHPGMTGAIVVGSGTGPASGAAVSLSSFDEPSTAPRSPAAGSTSPIGWAAAAAIIGLGVGAALGFVLAERRRRAPAVA